MLDPLYIELAKELNEQLRVVANSIVEQTADLIHDLRVLDENSRDTEDQERAFWLTAEQMSWLAGPNPDARKRAKERAYEEHADDAPWYLKTRARTIAEMKVEIEATQLRLSGYRSELSALQTRAGLLPTLLQAEQSADQVADLFRSARLAVAS